MPKRQLTLRQQDARTAWLLLIPSLLVILGVTLWPVISTFILSFFNAPTGINQVRTFVGFGNYLDMLKDQTFWDTIGRTLYFTVVSVGLELAIGLAVPAHQFDRPLGSAYNRKWRYVAVDLQRRLRRLERPAHATWVDQSLRSVVIPARNGDEPCDRGRYLAHDAVRSLGAASRACNASRGSG